MSQEVARKVRDGHLIDFSVTANPLEIIELRAGEKYRSIQGPADVVTRWAPLDVSVVAAGADYLATVKQ